MFVPAQPIAPPAIAPPDNLFAPGTTQGMSQAQIQAQLTNQGLAQAPGTSTMLWAFAAAAAIAYFITPGRKH